MTLTTFFSATPARSAERGPAADQSPPATEPHGDPKSDDSDEQDFTEDEQHAGDLRAPDRSFVEIDRQRGACALDPEAYLRDLFRVLPQWPRDRYIELAPKYWTATRARLDAAQLEIEIGWITIPPPREQSSAS